MSIDTSRKWLRRLLSWRALAILALWSGSVAAAGVAGAFAYRERASIRALWGARVESAIIETNLYNVSAQKLLVPAEGREGGIAPLGDGILFANRLGQMWFVEPDLSLHELSLRVPINYDEFAADPFNVKTDRRDQFAVKDLQVQPLGQQVRVMAAFNYWHAEPDCYVVRVGTLEASVESILSDGVGIQDQWNTVYETACRPMSTDPAGNPHPSNGAGGRLAALSDHEILLTLGSFSPDTIRRDPDPAGTTVLIDLKSGQSRVFTSGHRNPQGLTVAPSGEIWETEHGERGGDELNQIVEGAHYGFPFVAYGTAYESLVWPTNPHQGRHEGYKKPLFAWVPSIGISQVIVIEGPLFEHWQGDLLVSSLVGQSLFRVRIEEGRVIFVEPIPIGERIRGLTQRRDGAIVLKTDQNFLWFLTPLDAAAAADLKPEARGQILATACAGCHSFEPSAGDAIGPNLWGVVGRRVASREGYAYSEAMRAKGGRWTPDALRDLLADPGALVPGTTMETVTIYDEAQIEDLVAYLSSLR